MPKIIFSEERHSYTHEDGTDFMSVSKKFAKFKTPFDSYNIAKKKVLTTLFKKEYTALKTKYKYNDPIVLESLSALISEEALAPLITELLAEWEATGNTARTFGTHIHKVKELSDIATGYTWCHLDGLYYNIVNPPKQYDNQSLVDNLYDLEDGCYPELLLFDEETKTSGQSDKVYISTIGKDRIIHVSDYKTDANILLKPDFYERGVGYKCFLYELSHLRACNFNEYSVKMSIYARILEKAGFKVGKIEIEQLITDETKEIVATKHFKVPYRSLEADIVMEK